MPTSEVKTRARWLVEIESWDWSLGLRMATTETPADAKFHGELMYARGVDIKGQLVAPNAHAGEAIRVTLSPTPLRYWTGPDALDEIGQFTAHERRGGRDLSATVLIPEDSLSNVLACLATVWRYIHLWTIDSLPRASISGASFSRELHENLGPWIRGEGHADF